MGLVEQEFRIHNTRSEFNERGAGWTMNEKQYAHEKALVLL